MLNPDVYFKCFFYIGLLVTLSLTQRPWPYLRTPWTTNCSERVFPRLVVCHFGSIALFCRLHIFLITYIMITALDASFYDAISYIWWKYTLWISSDFFFCNSLPSLSEHIDCTVYPSCHTDKAFSLPFCCPTHQYLKYNFWSILFICRSLFLVPWSQSVTNMF
jgi:hypothetical protein